MTKKLSSGHGSSTCLSIHLTGHELWLGATHRGGPRSTLRVLTGR